MIEVYLVHIWLTRLTRYLILLLVIRRALPPTDRDVSTGRLASAVGTFARTPAQLRRGPSNDGCLDRARLANATQAWGSAPPPSWSHAGKWQRTGRSRHPRPMALRRPATGRPRRVRPTSLARAAPPWLSPPIRQGSLPALAARPRPTEAGQASDRRLAHADNP